MEESVFVEKKQMVSAFIGNGTANGEKGAPGTAEKRNSEGRFMK